MGTFLGSWSWSFGYVKGVEMVVLVVGSLQIDTCFVGIVSLDIYVSDLFFWDEIRFLP